MQRLALLRDAILVYKHSVRPRNPWPGERDVNVLGLEQCGVVVCHVTRIAKRQQTNGTGDRSDLNQGTAV